MSNKHLILVVFVIAVVKGKVVCVLFDSAEVDKVIQASFQCHRNPGVIVSVVRNGTVLFAKGYGVTDLDRNNPVTKDTVFNVASVTKNMAAALLVKILYTKTNLTVDSKVRDLIGSKFQMMDAFRSSEITFSDVMGHRTGVPPNNVIRFDSNLTRKGLLKRLAHLSTPDQFRVKFYYNNLMYGLVTYLSEVLGKEPWEALVKKHFFNPLGMRKSTFVTQVDYGRGDVAWPYVIDNGTLLRVPFEHSRRWGVLAGSVALATTAEDMTQWMNFHLSKGRNHEGKIVMEEEQLSELYKPRMARPSPTSHDFSKPSVPHTISKNSYTFGLRRGFYRGYTRFSHSGSNHGFRALLSLLPTEGVGVFMAMNGRDDSYQYRQPLHMYLMDLALGLEPWLNASTICSYPSPWLPPVDAKPAVDINTTVPLLLDHRKYEGTYYNEAYGNLDIVFDSSNLVLRYGWATWYLFPRRTEGGQELFYARGANLSVAYNVDPIEFIQESSVITTVKATGFEPHAPPLFRRQGSSTNGQQPKGSKSKTGNGSSAHGHSSNKWSGVLLIFTISLYRLTSALLPS